MSHDTPQIPFSPDKPAYADGFFQSLPDLPELMRFHCKQLDAMHAWHISLLKLNQDFWGQWMCLCAGGVPIDA
jgi:hypothetical protein